MAFTAASDAAAAADDDDDDDDDHTGEVQVSSYLSLDDMLHHIQVRHFHINVLYLY